VQFPPVGIDMQPAAGVGMQLDCVAADGEAPWLGVVHRRRPGRHFDQVLGLLGQDPRGGRRLGHVRTLSRATAGDSGRSARDVGDFGPYVVLCGRPTMPHARLTASGRFRLPGV